jgi:hypothetical protein
MQIRCDATIPFPRPLVWGAYRDKLVELVPYLPNIRKIEVKKREQTAGAVTFVNVWHGGGDIPAVARAFLSESMLSWTDFATWHEDRWECEWRTETHAFTEAVKSQGANRYHEVDGAKGTRLEIRGDLTIDGAKLKGVPRLIAGKVARTVEEFLVKLISQNLRDVSGGVTKYLQATAGGG